MDFLDWLHAHGGVCTMYAARERLPRDTIDAMRGTTLWSPMRGWLALVGVRDDVTAALQHGGVASCVTAFRKHGLWMPHGPQHLHIRVNRETHSARVDAAEHARGVTVHRMHMRLPDQRPSHGVDPVLAALAVASGCIGAEELVAAADSALLAGLVTKEDVHALAAMLPRRKRRALELVSDRSGSGTESIVAAMLRRHRIGFVQQAELVRGQLVDFLVGSSLVIEIDSLAWHGSRAQMATDRRRDAALMRMGYRVLRFTYEQVLFEREFVEGTILALIRRDVHLRAPWA